MAGPLDEAFVEITADLDVSQVRRAARNASRTVERSLTQGVERAERSISRGIGRIGSDTGQEFGDGFSSGLSDTLSSIADIKLPVPAFAALSLALASAAASAVQFAAALAPAVGIVAALPSGIGVLAAGMTTLSVATLGVGEAFEAAATGTAEEFNTAMEGLAPPVQAAAQAIRDLMPELEELRNSVQGAFFQDFDDVLNTLAETLLGPVTTGMTSVATEINGIIVGLAAVATSAEGVDFVNQSFSIMAGILAQLQEPLAALFEALLNVGNAINDAFGENAGAGLANLITQFAAFLDQAAASGQAVQWVDQALKTFTLIGDILEPIVGILASVGAAAQTTGGNILGAFGEALRVVDDFLASAQGQEVLISIFEALNQVGDAFAVVLRNLAPAIVPLVSGLSSILGAVAPLLGPLSQLVGSVLTALAPILGLVADAIQPIIAPLTTIIELFGGFLVVAIEAVMPLIQQMLTSLQGPLSAALSVVSAVLVALLPLFEALLPILEPLLVIMNPVAEIFGVLAELLGAVLVPIIQVLGDILLWLVDNIITPFVVPAVEALADLLQAGLGAAINWLVEQFRLAGIGFKIIWETIKDVIGDNIETIVAGWKAFQIAFQVGWAFINNNVFTPIKNGINLVKSTIKSALDGIKDGWSDFVDNVRAIPGRISGALSDMFSPLASGFKSAINAIIRGWNNLSFSIPSVDIPGLGTVGGGTINTPNIPYLASGALATGPTLAMIGEGRFNEALLPLGDPRVDSLLASALGRAGVMNQASADTGEGAVNAVAHSGDNFFLVKIGEREITDIIVEQQNEMNQDMLRRARAGTGRRG
jgi:phage-related protein